MTPRTQDTTRRRRQQRGGARPATARAVAAGLLPVPTGVTTARQVTRMRRAQGMAVDAVPVPLTASSPADPSRDERRCAARARAESEALRILRAHRGTVGFAAAERAAARAFAHALRDYPEARDAALAGRPVRFCEEAERYWHVLESQASAERAAGRAG